MRLMIGLSFGSGARVDSLEEGGGAGVDDRVVVW